jgi:hypothetical protein
MSCKHVTVSISSTYAAVRFMHQTSYTSQYALINIMRMSVHRRTQHHTVLQHHAYECASLSRRHTVMQYDATQD